jgi:large subunit ribosomal protein L3
MKALLGTKIGMTQLLQEDGVAIPVTIVQAGPCTVTQVKSSETDGYNAVQIGYGTGKNLSNATKGHVAASKATPRHIREVRVSDLPENVTVGNTFDVSIFEVGDNVDATGTSKGKGFAGTVKRHNFTTGPKSHGGMNYRKPGSIGSMYPQKVMKGKRMAGRMGAERVTVKNLTVALVDAERGIIGLKGAVPGPRRGLIFISDPRQNFVVNIEAEQQTEGGNE